MGAAHGQPPEKVPTSQQQGCQGTVDVAQVVGGGKLARWAQGQQRRIGAEEAVNEESKEEGIRHSELSWKGESHQEQNQEDTSKGQRIASEPRTEGRKDFWDEPSRQQQPIASFWWNSKELRQSC